MSTFIRFTNENSFEHFIYEMSEFLPWYVDECTTLVLGLEDSKEDAEEYAEYLAGKEWLDDDPEEWGSILEDVPNAETLLYLTKRGNWLEDAFKDYKLIGGSYEALKHGWNHVVLVGYKTPSCR